MSTEIKANSASSHIAWNKGRLVGQKRPSPSAEGGLGYSRPTKRRKRDLAMFNLAIASKLSGCDLVSLRVDDIASGGHVRGRRRSSSTRPAVRFSLRSRNRPESRCRIG